MASSEVSLDLVMTTLPLLLGDFQSSVPFGENLLVKN
jgi:hypothetical protein